jgi:hypothetical protein
MLLHPPEIPPIPVETLRVAVWTEQDHILFPIKGEPLGTEDPVADTKGGQPCNAANGTAKPKR